MNGLVGMKKLRDVNINIYTQWVSDFLQVHELCWDNRYNSCLRKENDLKINI